MKKVEDFRVGDAVRVLEYFCEKHKVKLEAMMIAHFALAWSRGESFEWTPSAPAFYRILAVAPEGWHKNTVAIVLDSNGGIKKELTEELNKGIFELTGGRWFTEKP